MSDSPSPRVELPGKGEQRSSAAEPHSSPATDNLISAADFAERLAQVPVFPHNHESVMVRRRMRYPHRRETQYHNAKVHDDMVAEERHEAIRRSKRYRMPDWRKLLADLLAATPRYLNGVARVHVSQLAAERLLLPDQYDNVWDIKSRTGCYIELEKKPDRDGHAVLRVSGPRSVIEAAIDSVVQVSQSAKVFLDSAASGTLESTLQNGDPGREPQVIERRRSHLYRLFQPPDLTVRAEDVVRPAPWTKASFETYIATLTLGRLPKMLASKLYPNEGNHQDAVVKELLDSFYADETQDALSIPAFRLALEFMARKGAMFRKHALELFDYMLARGFREDVALLNILIESTVNDRHLKNFSSLVYLMLRRGHKPNVRTWLLLLRQIKSEEVKRYILQAMHYKNMFGSSTTIARVANEMAPYDVERAVHNGWNLQAFLAAQDKLYGPVWLNWKHSRFTLNRVVHVLGKHSMFEEIRQLLDFMASHSYGHIRPNLVTLNTILEHCKIQRKVQVAVEMLKWFEEHGIAAGVLALESLFKIARHYKMPHAVDIIWQYAALTVQTNYEMRRRIGKILGAYRDRDPKDISLLSDTIPQGDKPKELAMWALLRASAKERFGCTGKGRDSIILADVVERAFVMWEAGCVPATPLNHRLSEALDKDMRFFGDLKDGKWTLDPAEIPIMNTNKKTVPTLEQWKAISSMESAKFEPETEKLEEVDDIEI